MTRPSCLMAICLAMAAMAYDLMLNVDTTRGNASSPLLYGIAFEDINHSGDGGIHGQLLQNNAFQGSNPGLTGYSAIGPVKLSVTTAHPLSPAIGRSLEVAVPPGTKGHVGFSNAGYQGIPVNADSYRNRWYVKGYYLGPMTVTVYGPSGRAYGSIPMIVHTNSSVYSHCETSFVSAQSLEDSNAWKLTFDAIVVAGSSLYFTLVQLFPVTYHNRDNGLRNDIATYLEKLSPSFLRFPGGNNLEGATRESRWKWNETIGPLMLRPGRQGAWGYPNTDALGLMEYMQWCIDMRMEPVLAVWAGLSLDTSVVPGESQTPYIEDILNELEFLLGDAATPYGALRAKYGRTEPYTLRYIEIGNEDNLSGGCVTYASRFASIYSYVHPLYPSLILIASTGQATCLPESFPAGAYMDIHHYLTPDQFVRLFNEFDHTPRHGDFGVIVGEYASLLNNSGAVKQWQDMQGSCGEAVYMIGLERNSDVVKMASYAPLLEHYGMAQWSPSLFGFNSSVGSITGSTSFWVQSMFSRNRGTTILPVSSTANFGPVYWVASSKNLSKTRTVYYVKLANYGKKSQRVRIRFDGTTFGSKATYTVLSGLETTSNYPRNSTITPKVSTVGGDSARGYSVNIPAWGVAVFAVDR